MVALRSSLSVVVAMLMSCGGGQKPPAPAPGPGPSSGSASPAPAGHDEDPCAEPTAPAGPTGSVSQAPPPPPPPPLAEVPPELFPPVWKKVGVGRTVHFSVAAIDQNLDETRVEVTAMPKSATFDAITQTVSWTPTKADVPKAAFELRVTQEARGKSDTRTWTFAVDPKPQPMPVAEVQTPIIETVLMIRQGKRLEEVNKAWPLDRLLLVGAETFKLQIPADKRGGIAPLDKAALWTGFLAALAQTHNNPRLDPASDKFDKAVFGDPGAWRIVAVRPRIDKAWTELRVVYRAVKAAQPVYAMFRLRPTVEYVPALPRPEQERIDNNKVFLGMVAKHLLVDGGPSDALMKDPIAHGKAVAALMTELMTYDETRKAPHLHGFMIGIAMEAQMGGGSLRNADGSYKSGDGWAWSAMKPFLTPDGKGQQYVNVIIPGFWTKTIAVDNGKGGKTWGPACAPKFIAGAPGHVSGYDVLCRKTMGFVDLPDTGGGKVKGGRIDANNLYLEHKQRDMLGGFPLEDGRRDLGEENGMTCAQCHIRNFGMHDYGDPANVDATKGAPTSRNKPIATLNIQIIPSSHWEAFTIEFLHHQECRGKQHLEEFLGAGAGKGLGCKLQK